MDNQDYEQQKKECWDAFDREHPHSGIITEMAFNFAFDRAYALGKQEKDAEEEEVLTVSRKKVQEEYIENLTASNEVAHSVITNTAVMMER